MQKLLKECYAEATRILTENRELLNEISEYLLIKETITGETLMAFIDPEKKAELLAREAEEKAAEEAAAKATEEAADTEAVEAEAVVEESVTEESAAEEIVEEETTDAEFEKEQ